MATSPSSCSKSFFGKPAARSSYEGRRHIDGANEWQIFWGFTMNLSRPILAVIALNAFIAAYGAAFASFALIITEQNMWTLMVWVYQLPRQMAGPSIVYASLLITAVPVLVVYPLRAKRHPARHRHPQRKMRRRDLPEDYRAGAALWSRGRFRLGDERITVRVFGLPPMSSASAADIAAARG